MSKETLRWIEDELTELDSQTLRRRLTSRSGPQRTKVVIDGEEFINFGSNDYLGLSADPEVLAAVSDSVRKSGWGSGASPLINGRSVRHSELERRIAAFENTEAALVFTTGYSANTGTIAALVGKGDVIFSDAKNHASLIDGCRLSRAQIVVYRHCDVDDLDEKMAEFGPTARRRLVVTDSLFSMDGDLAPLPDLAEIACRHSAMLMIDESHATGVFGSHGRGVAEHFGVESRIDVRSGTLSKALGSMGGFVVGSQAVIDLLLNRARSYFFSTAAPAATSAAALAALAVVRDQPQRRERLLAAATQLRERLIALGWNVGASASQIIPIILGAPQPAIDLAARLKKAGLFVPVIRPPSVPKGESMLRISLSSEHSTTMVDQLVNELGRSD